MVYGNKGINIMDPCWRVEKRVNAWIHGDLGQLRGCLLLCYRGDRS